MKPHRPMRHLQPKWEPPSQAPPLSQCAAVLMTKLQAMYTEQLWVGIYSSPQRLRRPLFWEGFSVSAAFMGGGPLSLSSWDPVLLAPSPIRCGEGLPLALLGGGGPCQPPRHAAWCPEALTLGESEPLAAVPEAAAGSLGFRLLPPRGGLLRAVQCGGASEHRWGRASVWLSDPGDGSC